MMDSDPAQKARSKDISGRKLQVIFASEAGPCTPGDPQQKKEQILSTHDDERIGIATTRRIYLQNFRKVTNVNNIIKLL